MKAVEIDEAISKLAEQPFDADKFPFAFLNACGNNVTTIKRLHSGASNKSDAGGVLKANNIHLTVTECGAGAEVLSALNANLATNKGSLSIPADTREWFFAQLAVQGIKDGSISEFIYNVREPRLTSRKEKTWSNASDA